ncbi:MAG: DUF6350 family protein, partial [Actinomycetes bacterium]
MNRRLSFAFAGLEALFVSVLGLAILLLPVGIVFIFENDASVDFATTFRTVVDIWLLAQGVSIQVSAGQLLGTAVPAFAISLVPIGLTLVILAAAFRVGRRYAGAATLWPVWVGAGGTYAVISWLLASAAVTKNIYPVSWMTTLLPTLLFTSALVLGSLTGKRFNHQAPEREVLENWWTERKRKLNWVIRVLWQPAWRAGSIAVALLILISAITVGVLLALNWISVTRLYEVLQVSVLGGFLVTFAQMALLPNLIVYTASWFTGAGFSIGSGGSISPFGTALGPLPSVPVFGAIPNGTLSFALAALAVPMLCAVVATLAVRRSADEIRFEFASAFTAALS